MDNYAFSVQQGLYTVLRAGEPIGKIQPGALLNHYGVILVVGKTAISYSVICPDPQVDPGAVIKQLLDGFRTREVSFTIVAQGLFTAQIISASIFLLCGGIGICGLWLHEVDGVEMYLRDTPDVAYWVDVINSKLTVGTELKILQQDAINLRYAFTKLVEKSKKS